MNEIMKQDLNFIFEGLSEQEREKLKGSSVLLTGAAGFLGFYLVNFLAAYKEQLQIRDIMCLDNFRNGKPKWIENLSQTEKIQLYHFDIVTDSLDGIGPAENADYVFHMASIASPTFYRKYPIETMEANVMGLNRLLNFYCDKKLRGFVFFSSSEIYGDPTPDMIPTPESYRGNVNCQGPRACYDEAKRFGETMCYLYYQKYELPITIIRPFNCYGPGMRLNDARVPADFANAVRKGEDIHIYSDGSPTRCFCYVSDAVTGYLKCLLHADEGLETYNIGMDLPEISIRQLAEIYTEAGREIMDYKGEAHFAVSEDADYLKHNPNRRCADISKARAKLDYQPSIQVNEGVRRYLQYIKNSEGQELVW